MGHNSATKNYIEHFLYFHFTEERNFFDYMRHVMRKPVSFILCFIYTKVKFSCVINKNIIMSSFKSSRDIQTKEGGPDSCFGKSILFSDPE